MTEEFDLGPCPAEEDAIQIGHFDYPRDARKQCNAYIEAIRKVCGPEPEGARLRITTNLHDYGTYFSVAVRFDPDDRSAVDYALKVEGKAPTTWEEAGVPDPLLSKGRGL